METAYIQWNVDPEIFSLFGFISIRYYSLLFFTGLALGYLLVKKYFVDENVPVDKLDQLALFIFIGTLLGARIGHCLFYEPEYFLKHPLEILLPFRDIPGKGFTFTGFQGLASHGGAVGVLIAIIIFAKKSKTGLFWVLDRVAVAIPLTGACIRLGNLMNSEILGKPAQVSWAFVFNRVDGIPRHPAQLYEALLYLAIFILLVWMFPRFGKTRQQGFTFGVFLTLLFGVRIFVEFFKENQVGFEESLFINMGQILSIPFVIAGLVLIVMKFKTES